MRRVFLCSALSVAIGMVVVGTAITQNNTSKASRVVAPSEMRMYSAKLKENVALSSATLQQGKIEIPLRDVADLERYEVVTRQGASTFRADTSRLKLLQQKLIMRPNEVAILRPKAETKETYVLSSEKVHVPARMFQSSPAGPGGELNLSSWSSFVMARQVPLKWNGRARAYQTKLVVGVDKDVPSAPTTLPHTVTFEFFTQGAGANVNPVRASVTEAGPGNYATPEPTLRCTMHADSAMIQTKSDFGTHTYIIPFEPELAGLRLQTNKKKILGFGFETAEVTVERLAEDGREWAAGEDLPVILESDEAVCPSSLTIPAGETAASGRVRSKGLHRGVIKAVAGAISSEKLTITYEGPWLLLGIGVVFGGLGGWLRSRKVQSSQDPKDRKPGKVVARLIVGAVVGVIFIAAVAVAIVRPTGVNATTILSEAAAAVVALAAGFFGLQVLELIGKALGMAGKEAPAQ